MVWDHITGLTLLPFIEMHVPRQESERSCICVLDVPIFSSFYDLDFGFWNFPTLCYFFIFHFNTAFIEFKI